ncbi:uncharacterized protein IL334_003289 [Kwoniella shivajii]|uniref:DUF6534 domain-containing protein n=1 Tax=Kwoniella shivajii TaxID=564305 RepID=A0ABZ1CYV1_9TREE|nr:hypothetical protein IL334_003289 [Kwoniella shivajii]
MVATDEEIKEMILEHPMKYLGPFFFGAVLDTLLYGVIISKIIYWGDWSAKSDSRKNRIVVFLIFCLSTGATVYIIYWMSTLFVQGFGKSYQSFLSFHYLAWYSVWEVGACTVSHLYYTERAYRLNDNRKWIPLVILPLLLISIAGAIGVRVASFKYSSLLLAGKFSSFAYTWLITGALIDIILLIAMTKGLAKSKTGWSTTDHLLKKLIKLSVETQLPGTLLAIGFMLQYGIRPTSTFCVIWAVVLPKTYMICLMTVINSRVTLRRTLETLRESEENDNVYRPRRNGCHERDDDIPVGPISYPTVFIESSVAELELDDRMQEVK